MNEETNENVDGIVPVNDNVENAFSDLISEFFENDGVTANAQQQINTTTLDWDNVSNGQLYQNISADTVTGGTNQVAGTTGTGILYTNLDTTVDTTTTTNETTSTGTPVEQATEPTTEVGQVGGYSAIYNDIEGVGTVTPTDTETTVTSTVDLGGTRIASAVDTVVNTPETATTGTNTTGEEVTDAGTTEFKLTQANLPAKIGFWTKVRNFFMPEARINYSLQQPTTNTGIWNKVQSFFSFGKNK